MVFRSHWRPSAPRVRSGVCVELYDLILFSCIAFTAATRYCCCLALLYGCYTLLLSSSIALATASIPFKAATRTVVVLHCSCDCLNTLLLYSSLNTDAPTRWVFQLIRLPTTRLCCFYICSDQPSLLTKRNSPLPSRSIRTKRYCDINCFSCCVIWLF